jgi:hypothetical protein
MRSLILCIAVLTFTSAFAQKKDKGNPYSSAGVISLGGRSTFSLFNHGDSKSGSGIGGQFRVQLADMVNSDWFFDYITAPIGNYANRTDYHIGWSVLFYPMPVTEKTPLLKPYVLVGHCFDYTKVSENASRDNYGERWSSAVQGGLGTHLNLTKRCDISFTGQYMIHLGTDIHASQVSEQVIIVKEKGSSLEGHLLLTASLNYKIADLW